MTRHRNRRGAIGAGTGEVSMTWRDYVRLTQIWCTLALILSTPTLAAALETGRLPQLPF